MTFLWSDAWLFQAIAVAARARPAALAEVLGAADAANHALPTDEELHGALSRLTGAGYVEEIDQKFQLTDRVPAEIADAIATGGWAKGRSAASAFLNAEPWSHDRNVGDPRNRVKYAGLTSERIISADTEYRRRVSRS
jgi:hypothetical protein